MDWIKLEKAGWMEGAGARERTPPIHKFTIPPPGY